MGDSACLMHGFSYASAIPTQSEQGNPMRVLGESVSFGRFMSESEPLSWDRWSSFPHKKYVEEAARYAQPGSVAEKKAFFEAHYKKIAAQKAAAAAAAAALLEQEKAEAERALENPAVKLENNHDDEVSALTTIHDGSEQRISISLSENLDAASCSEGNGTPQMEKPLLKESRVGRDDISSATSKKKTSLSSLRSSIRRKTWKAPPTPMKPATPHLKKSSMESIDKRKPYPKSLSGLINLIPTKEPDKAPVSVAKKAPNSGLNLSFSRTPKDCKTPIRTPIVAAAKGVAENIRMKTPMNSSDFGSKTSGPKWHILSTVCTKSLTACRNKLQSPASSTPFVLRTEERAARRKQKLEEKFNTNVEQKAQLQMTLKEKAGLEFKKLSQSFCFKARPLPDFYKERETPASQMKKTPAIRAQTVVLGRSNSKKQQHGSVSVPPPQSFTKNGGAFKNPSANPSKFVTSSLSRRITHENKSPNIQH